MAHYVVQRKNDKGTFFFKYINQSTGLFVFVKDRMQATIYADEKIARDTLRECKKYPGQSRINDFSLKTTK